MNIIKNFFKPIDLTKGKPWKVIIYLAIPILLSQILGNAFSLINALIGMKGYISYEKCLLSFYVA